MVSSTLGNAQTAAKITSVTVASDMEPKKILGKSQKSSSLPLFLRNFLGIPSEEVEGGSGGTKEQRKFFSSTS